MMILQAVLTLVFIAMGVNFIRSRHSSRIKAYKKLILLLSIPLAVLFVLFPELTNSIARSVGIGRGADLLLYGLTVVVLFQLFNTYIKDRESERRFVKLVRKTAILEAELHNIKEPKKQSGK